MTAITTTTTAAKRPPPAALRVTHCNSVADQAAWSWYVAQAPQATFFHELTWLDAVSVHFQHRPQHLIAWRGHAVVGVLPLHALRSPLAGRLLISTPYATYGGIVADDPAAAEALAGVAVRLVYELQAASLQLRSDTAGIDDLPHDDRYAGFRKPLPPDLPGLRTYLPRKARAAARQAETRDGIVVVHDNARLPELYLLYARSMRRLGSLNLPRAFFATLRDQLGPRCWISLAYQGARPVAGLLSFVHRDTVLPYYLGVDERVRSTGVTNLLYRAVMERAVKAQLRTFDFGRTRYENKGPFAFKVNQGFEPRTLGYQTYVPAGQTPADLTPANPRYRLARSLWCRLPLGVTRSVGQRLSRWVAG
jgi:FemAB-related protein (PEP-CTERM system-associated)